MRVIYLGFLSVGLLIAAACAPAAMPTSPVTEPESPTTTPEEPIESPAPELPSEEPIELNLKDIEKLSPDTDSDGDVDSADLAQVLGCWGDPFGAGQFCPCLDVEPDGDIDSADLAEILIRWGGDANMNGIPDNCES